MTGRFQIEDAVRRGNKARVALAGGPGSGKTWTALTLAVELAGDGPLLVIDTERRSASLYADVFRFRTIAWDPPYDPRELADVVRDVAGSHAVVVVDSHSHFWVGRGGTLAIVDEAARRARNNRFAGWKDGTPAQDAMVDAILTAPCHVITTMRSKMGYVQEKDDRDRTVVRRVGMAPIQRDGIEYEFTVTAQLEADHRLVITKTRCPSLAPSYAPGAAGEMGRALRTWLDGASDAPVSEGGETSGTSGNPRGEVATSRHMSYIQPSQRPPDPGRPFDEGDEVLAGVEWARTFARAVRESGWDDKVRAALVHFATGGRTDSGRAVLKSEVGRVRAAYKSLSEGRLVVATVDGAVALTPAGSSSAA